MRGFYFITDASLSRAGIYSDVKKALAAGVKVIQYRRKDADTKTLYEEALRLRRICRKAIFLVNDRVDIALAVEADGVHLGQDDLPCAIARRLLGPKKIIGVTVHDLKEAMQAQKQRADYLGVAPVFKTKTKKDAGSPAGTALIRKIKERLRIPVIAIGGIDLSNASEVIEAGADGLCAISAVVKKRDVAEEIRKFQRLFNEA